MMWVTLSSFLAGVGGTLGFVLQVLGTRQLTVAAGRRRLRWSGVPVAQQGYPADSRGILPVTLVFGIIVMGCGATIFATTRALPISAVFFISAVIVLGTWTVQISRHNRSLSPNGRMHDETAP